MAPNMPHQIKLLKRSSLSDLEGLLARIGTAPGRIQIWLPADLGSGLFKESRAVALLASAASKGLTVVDWTPDSDPARDRRRFGQTIEGLAGLIYSDEIKNIRAVPLELNREEVRWDIIDREGILEPSCSRGSSLTFCAFDDDDDAPSQPIALMGLETKEMFIPVFTRYRQTHFEIGVGADYSERIAPDLFDHAEQGFNGSAAIDADRVLAGFVFELFKNTLEHGCKDAEGATIPGLRWIRIRKHIGHKKHEFINAHAKSFPTLQAYLDTVIGEEGTCKFYEVAISDNGLGIIDRFVATRPEHATNGTIEGKVALVNRIIEQALSSKRAQSGAGHGLRKALKAARRLRGFVSLRTDRVWVCASSTDRAPAEQRPLLTPVSAEHEFSPVRGTHFNMLFPMV
jgi:hypothetical protein